MKPLRTVVIAAPAKLNLTLDIVGIQDDGYHQMDMLMQTVSLYEKVTISRAQDITVTLPGSFVQGGANNTAYKAAVAFFQETGLLAGAQIVIEKKIPVRAGMAGGSADAAAVLVGLNLLYHAKLTMDELCKIGLKVGADVPFSLKGGTMRAQGIGEILTQEPLCPKCWFTVVMPPNGVATPKAYAEYDAKGTSIRPDTNLALKALQQKDLKLLCSAMANALQESSPSIYNEDICSRLKACGALTAQMTGSGAAVFGVFSTQENAYKAQRELKQYYDACWVLHPVKRGAHKMEHTRKRRKINKK